MFSSLTFVVFMSAILVIFSKELGGLVKKLWGIPAIALMLPLFLTSLFLVDFDEAVGKFLIEVWIFLHSAPVLLAKNLPYPAVFSALFSIVMLTLPPVLSVGILQLWWKRNYNVPFVWGYTAGILIWLFFAAVFSV